MRLDNITARLANLSPAKRALFEQRLTEKSLESSVTSSIPRRSTRNTAPLSFAQERLWFLNQLEPESPAYNESKAFRLSGVLDLDALKRTLNQIVLRHEVLRTTIVTMDGSPRQVVAQNRHVELPVIDLRAVPKTDRDPEAQRLIVETMRKPFDLSRDLMLRVLLLRLAEQEHVFLVVKHHIASDGWSSGIFWQEVTALYEAYTSGQSADLQELPVQYADYAAWQRDWFQGDVLETQLSYWGKQLDNLGTLQLPTDRPRPAIQSFGGAKQTFILAKDLSAALKALSLTHGVTLFMTLLAAFQALLYRYTGQENIAVGSPIAGRNRVEIEGLLGFFVNTLVLRIDVSGKLAFKELLERVRGMCLDAYSHQDLPFEKLVEELAPQRVLNHNPLFQVTFQLNNVPRRLVKLPAIDVEDMELDSGIAKFDLSLTMTDRGEDIAGRLQYNTDLFDEATMARMLGHFQTLLEGVVADPDRYVADLPLITQAERRQLLFEWNETKRDYPKGKCLHQLFEKQAEQTPDSVAVVFEDQQLTYGDLNRRANRLAHYLMRLGVGPETPVGICVERSLEMIIGLLGILKAGGVYVPLDPSYPKQRLAFMLADTQAPVLLSRERLMEKLPSDDSHVVVCLDRDWQEIAKQSEKIPESGVTEDHLAYVIYTSGSTGNPKGVLIEHRQILNYVQAIRDRCRLEPGASFAMVQPLSFDASQTVLFPSLISGGCLHILSEEKATDPQALGEYFRRFPIDLLKITPSHLAALQVSSPSGQILPRRWLIIGGEAWHRDWLVKVQATGDCSIFNHYGPTEATVAVLTYELKAGKVDGGSSTVPIGHPLPNIRAYLLDRYLHPVPIGVPGELYIGGSCLGRGYLNSPDLTAEKFIPNPFSDEPGARLYKTGDRSRYLADGNVEFLGRTDHQVKIRGYRIEPGEIEAALRQHPSVQQAIILAREDVESAEGGLQISESGGENPKGKTCAEQSRRIENPKSEDKRLIAYVVARPDRAPTAGGKSRYRLPNGAAVRDGADIQPIPVLNNPILSTADLKNFLDNKLPGYMVPSVFMFLEALPLSPNGKVDRKALPAPTQIRRELDETFLAPRTAVETLLVNIWAEVLRLDLDKVGIHDNFFDLGGHSLLATQVMSRAREAFQVEVLLRDLFEAPTVAELASKIDPRASASSKLRELARSLSEVESLSPEEARRLLAEEATET